MKPIKQKKFEHYLSLYVKNCREIRCLKTTEEINAAEKRKGDALKGMVTFYPDETKTTLLELMNDGDIWFALISAQDYAYSFELTFDVKTKIFQTVKRCENSKKCTAVEKVNLMVFSLYVEHK